VPSSRFYIFFDFFKHPCLISNKKHYLCAHKKVHIFDALINTYENK
jgi:phosphoribosyl-dephospho-CoA transferase